MICDKYWKKEVFPDHSSHFCVLIKLDKKIEDVTWSSVAIPIQETSLRYSVLHEFGRQTSTGSHEKPKFTNTI